MTVREIRRVRRAFKSLFGVLPVIRVTGIFGVQAYVKTTDDNPTDQWNLTVTGQYYKVRTIGQITLFVELERGLNKGL